MSRAAYRNGGIQEIIDVRICSDRQAQRRKLMVRRREGVGALYDYSPLVFSHIDIEPGASAVVLADPWAYLRSHLYQDWSKRAKSPARTRLNRAIYYTRQAEGFYAASANSDVETKGVLAYYGMLNLVKSFLSYSGVELETVKEHHGLTIPLGSPEDIEIASPATSGGVNIFHEFARLLGTPVSNKTTVSFIDAMHRVPELHGILKGTRQLAGKPSFLPVDFELCVSMDFKTYFEQVSFEKRHDNAINHSRFESGERKRYFKGPFFEPNGNIVYQSKAVRDFNKTKCAAVYRNSLRRLNAFNVTSLLTRTGYRYYIDLNPGKHHHLCCTLLIMFYLSSIERYRPTVVDEHFQSEKRPLLTEALAICPKQFLYQMVGRITRDLCVVPYSAI
jgi:YaaC-like Protein